MAIHSVIDLIDSIMKRDVVKVRHMLEEGADIEGAPKGGGRLRPIHHAAMAGNMEILDLLVNHKADVMALDATLRLPIHHAALCARTSAILSLLSCGNPVNAQDGRKCTPLHYALEIGANETARMLIQRGADVRARDWDGVTPMHHAAGTGNEGIVRILFDRGAEIDARNIEGRSPLMEAVIHGRARVVALLLDRGADPAAVDEHGNQPIHFARNPAEINMLVAKGADINARNNDGNAPLHVAAMHDIHQMLMHFLKIGADPAAENKAGSMPHGLANVDYNCAILRKAAEEWPARQEAECRKGFAALRRRLAALGALRPKSPAL